MNREKRLQSVCFFLLMLVLGACVDPFVLKPGQNPHMIVISGSITDQPGPYTINIYTNQPVDRTSLPQNISKAIVTISEDGGISETLTETSDGVYQTHLLQGQVGKSYVLNVITREGESYTSTVETILPVGNLSNLTAEFIEPYIPDINAELAARENGFNLYIDSDFDPGQESRAIWYWDGVFKFVTNPEARFHYLGTKTYIPDPVPCSGYVNMRGNLVQVGVCTCCECYHTQHNPTPNISNERDIRNNHITHQWVGFIPVNPRFFTEKLFVIVQQTSASTAVYKFWAAVKSNNEKGTDLFQTPPITTVGNISADNTGSTPVIGLFSAFAVKGDSIVLRTEMIPYQLDPPSMSLASCVDFYRKDNTTVRPSFYFVEP